jgi:chromosome segregation ATPase
VADPTLAELLTAERRKCRLLRFALSTAVGLILLLGGVLAWSADRQAAERGRLEALEGELRAERQRAEHERQKAEDEREALTLREVEAALQAAEVRKKLKAYEDDLERARREAAEPAVAPAPRAARP